MYVFCLAEYFLTLVVSSPTAVSQRCVRVVITGGFFVIKVRWEYLLACKNCLPSPLHLSSRLFTFLVVLVGFLALPIFVFGASLKPPPRQSERPPRHSRHFRVPLPSVSWLTQCNRD